LILLWPEEKVG